MIASGACCSDLKKPFHRRELDGLIVRHVRAVPIARREDHDHRGEEPDHQSGAQETVSVDFIAPPEHVERPDARDDERARDGGAGHHVEILPLRER